MLRSRPSFYFRDSKGTMLPSSLEERIRLLTDRAIAAKSQSELDAILPELKAAIREHIRCVRDIAVATIPRHSRRATRLNYLGTRFPPSN